MCFECSQRGQGSTHQGPGALAPMRLHLLLPPHLPWAGSWLHSPSPPQNPGFCPACPSGLLPRAMTVSWQSIKPTCVPPLPSGPGGDWMQVPVGLRLGEHHLWHLQHGCAISALGWQGHSVRFRGTWQRWVLRLLSRTLRVSWWLSPHRELPFYCGWQNCAVGRGAGRLISLCPEGVQHIRRVRNGKPVNLAGTEPPLGVCEGLRSPCKCPHNQATTTWYSKQNTVTGQERVTTAQRKEFFINILVSLTALYLNKDPHTFMLQWVPQKI